MLKVLIVLGCVALLSCSESPFLSKEEALRLAEEINVSRDPFHAVKNVVAIIDNDIYYFNRLDTIKTHVKLSPDKTEIAYLNKNGNPVIIGASDGELIATLTEFNYITQMDWVKNSHTLYMLIGREVELYGDPVAFTQPESYHPWDDVSSFSMNSIGDQGYYIRRYNDTGGDKLEYHSTNKHLDEVYQNFDGLVYDYIDFYDDQGNFLLGFSYGEGVDRIVCVQNYNLWSAYEWDHESMQTPEFNATHEILLYGTIEGEEHYVKGVYLGTKAYPSHGAYDRLTKTLADYPSTTHVYVDWVQ
jgi:hypothetical protein